MENATVLKSTKKIESYVKLVYQAICKLFDNKVDNNRKESMDNSTTVGGVEDLDEYTIDEEIKLTTQLNDTLESNLAPLVDLTQSALALFKLTEATPVSQITYAVAPLHKLVATINHLLVIQSHYTESMGKLAYLSMRVFLYLVHKGFCGQDDPDDPDVEPPSDLEGDGMGMGDGGGE